MDIETITKFIDAGYTKADIEAMEAGAQKGEGNAADQQEAGKTNTKPAAKDSDSAESAGKVETPDTLEAIKALTATVNGLNETVKAMQEANAKNAKSATPSNDPIKAAMDSFLSTL